MSECQADTGTGRWERFRSLSEVAFLCFGAQCVLLLPQGVSENHAVARRQKLNLSQHDAYHPSLILPGCAFVCVGSAGVSMDCVSEMVQSEVPSVTRLHLCKDLGLGWI